MEKQFSVVVRMIPVGAFALSALAAAGLNNRVLALWLVVQSVVFAAWPKWLAFGSRGVARWTKLVSVTGASQPAGPAETFAGYEPEVGHLLGAYVSASVLTFGIVAPPMRDGLKVSAFLLAGGAILWWRARQRSVR